MRNKVWVVLLSTLCSAMFVSGAFAADSIGEQPLDTSASADAFAFG